MNPIGEGGQGGGVLGLLHKLPHIIPGGQTQLAGHLPIQGMVHHHINDGAAVVHHGQQFGLRLLGGMDAGHGPKQARGFPQFIPPGRSHNVQTRRAQQRDVPHDDLPAHGKLPCQGSGADPLF